jgi:NAD(P)-dependent dehydrogenase (short-subunit alcohol dehydrogenase family)
MKDIKDKTGNDQLEFIEIDMESLASVQEFASKFANRYDKLDILLNNAGVMTAPTPYSKDGIGYQFAVNHMAHYYLTILLLPLLQKAESARVVNVASDVYKFTSGLQLDKVNEDGFAGNLESYGISKLANIHFTQELSRRLEEKNIHVTIPY